MSNNASKTTPPAGQKSDKSLILIIILTATISVLAVVILILVVFVLLKSPGVDSTPNVAALPPTVASPTAVSTTIADTTQAIATAPVSIAKITPTISVPADLNILAPENGKAITGVQTFKAALPGLDLNKYNLFWQVDGDKLNLMDNNSTGNLYKEASADVTNWQWHGNGPYVINFVAKDPNNNILQQKSVQIFIAPAIGNVTPTASNTVVNLTSAQATSAAVSLNIKSPTDKAYLTGVQSFKAALTGMDLNQYTLAWQVDEGNLVKMENSTTDLAFKEASVDVDKFTWRNSGPYIINFVAKDAKGNVLQQRSVQIFIGAAPTTAPAH